MRIISGQARGLNLASPEGNGTRPTLDRVREAIFSMLFDRTHGAKVLDLFAGSGAMGLEAVSRGAAEADFVDIDPSSCRCVEKNIEKTRFSNCRVFNTDFQRFLENCNKKYDLVFLDPPYESQYYSKALELLKKRNLLQDGAMIVAECSISHVLDCQGFEVYRQRKYGKVNVYLLT